MELATGREPPATLGSGFLASAARHPGRPALVVEGETFSYAELSRRARSAAATLAAADEEPGVPLTGVFANRSLPAFEGVLASLLRGHGYVPLNPEFPAERLRSMLGQSGCRALVVDAAAAEALDAVLRGGERRYVILFPEEADVAALRERWPEHRVLGAADLVPPDSLPPAAADPESVAYLLFTSGTTGVPKGVPVLQRNAAAFLDVVTARYAVTAEDRFSQMFDLTFDLSVFDLFAAWRSGACVCCPTRAQVLTPAVYVREQALTVWFSVPSVAVLMKKLGALEPGLFPGLRWSLFCGEALTHEIAEAWSRAAPSSVVENLYGPTELTVACSAYRFDAGRSARDGENGLVPIGAPFPGMRALVVDEGLEAVGPGAAGELLLAGPQRTPGYWNAPERTAAAYVRPPGHEEVYYRTGDRVRAPRTPDAPLCYLGRVDHQIKVHGMRVELGEIEAVLREVAGVEVAVALGWPRNASGADGIVAFLQTAELDAAAVRRAAAERLPRYMVPRQVRNLARLPLNANGKVDRGALQRLLEEPTARAAGVGRGA